MMDGTKRMLMLVAAVLGAACVLGDEARPTGFRPPPCRTKIIRTGGLKSAKRLRATALPPSWDSRDHGWITSVKDQNPFGTCWTFAANAIIETQLLKAGRGVWDLSEKNMTMLCGFEGDWNSGGTFDMAAAYLLRWGGAVAETNDVYRYDEGAWNAHPSLPLDPALHIQNVVWIPALDGTEEARNALKAAIMEYGAVGASCCWLSTGENGSAYYYKGSADENHAVTVVGWDDSYSTNNFRASRRPPENGAWLIKNSWGTHSGENGFWHVSYCDTKFGKWESPVFVPATAEEDYTGVYGYDRLGLLSDIGMENDSFQIQAALFTSAWNEELAAVGVWTAIEENPYTITIYTNVLRGGTSPIEGGAAALTQRGVLTHAGYTTIHLEQPVALPNTKGFAVVYEQTGGATSHYVNYSSSDYTITDHQAGQTWLGQHRSAFGDITWTDLTKFYGIPKSCICLKAYTRTTVAARVDDAPGEAESGTAALAALAATNTAAYAQYGETFGAFANIVGANGRTLWASWLAGLDPANPSDHALSVSIAVSNDVPSLSWTPDLGDARTYTIWGRRDFSPTNGWEALSENALGATPHRFFKVSVSQP